MSPKGRSMSGCRAAWVLLGCVCPWVAAWLLGFMDSLGNASMVGLGVGPVLHVSMGGCLVGLPPPHPTGGGGGGGGGVPVLVVVGVVSSWWVFLLLILVVGVVLVFLSLCYWV